VESSTFVLEVPGLAHIPRASRLQVYRLLVQTGPEGLAAGGIAEQLGIPANTLSPTTSR
jgi:hypothetical protein